MLTKRRSYPRLILILITVFLLPIIPYLPFSPQVFARQTVLTRPLQGEIMARKALSDEEIARHRLDEIRSRIRQQKSNNDGRRMPARLDLGIQSATINVPGDFRTIQDAINAAIDGDTIQVASGTYKETLEIIDKDLTLKGEGKDNTIIDGINLMEQSTVFVDGGNINISGFTIKNGVSGLNIFNSKASVVTNNVIKNNLGDGLDLQETSSIKVIDNVIEKNSGDGIFVIEAKDVEISDNQITDNPFDGIAIVGSSAIIIKGNNVSANDWGIDVIDSIVEIVENSVSGNYDLGISCFSTTSFFTSVVSGCCNVVWGNGTNLDECPSTLLECPCPVGNPAEDRMLIEPASVLLTYIGASTQLTAILESLANGATTNVTKKAEWSSSDQSIVTVSPDGVLTAIGNGEVQICARFNEIQGCIQVSADTIHAGINQWTTSPEGERLGRGQIFDIAIDPIRTDVIYAGTGFGEIFKSLDRGESWEEKGDGGLRDGILALAIDPVNPDVLYAGAIGSIYKSSDAGETWDVIKEISSPSHQLGVGVNSLVIDPQHSDTLYAGTEGEGVLKSIDKGNTWKGVNNGLIFKNIRKGSLVIDPSNPEILYAAVETAGEIGKGVFKTTNGGGNWKGINRGLFKDVTGMAIDPENTEILYAGTFSRGVFKTTNGGERWFELEDSPQYSESLAVDNLNPDVIYVEGSGIFMSRDAGQSWARFDTQLAGRSVFALKIDPIHPSTIYAGAEEGVFWLTHSFDDIRATANPDGTSIDIEYQFNKDTGMAPLGLIFIEACRRKEILKRLQRDY